MPNSPTESSQPVKRGSWRRKLLILAGALLFHVAFQGVGLRALRTQVRGVTDLAVDRGTRTPLRFLVVDEANRLGQRQLVATGQDGGARDEVDAKRGDVSWISPIARALIKAREGDRVVLRTPAGEEKLELLEVSYP